MDKVTLEKIRKMIEDDSIAWLDDATAENYGTDGAIRYQQTALIDGVHVIVFWDTTPEYDDFEQNFKRKINLEEELLRGEVLDEEDEEFLKNYDETLEAYYQNDESNNCDWDNPVAIEILD